MRELVLPARRGTIYDREGEPLAVSIDARTVYAAPNTIKDKAGTAAALASVLGGTPKDYEGKLAKDTGFVYIARAIDVEQAKTLEDLNIKGIGFLDDSRRMYPSSELACQVLGFVGNEGQGLAGIEKRYNKVLAGNGGVLVGERDPYGRPIPGGVQKTFEPVDGHDIVLTIDKDIQYHAQTELAAAVEKFGAKGGSVVVMNPSNGEIYAMASTPGFNPNEYKEADPEGFRNRPISDAYEPGSTIKSLTAASVIDKGLYTPESRFDLPSTLTVAGRTIHESHDRANVNWTLEEIVTNSSNVGAVKLGLKLGKQGLYDYFAKFGLTEATGVDYPGEARGWLPKPAQWSASSIANIPFGQGVSATPLQLCRAVGAIANDGTLVTPHFLLKVPAGPGIRDQLPHAASDIARGGEVDHRDAQERGRGRHRNRGGRHRVRGGGQDRNGAGRAQERPRLRGRDLHRVVHRLPSRRRRAGAHLGEDRRAERGDLRRDRCSAGLLGAGAVLGRAPQDPAVDGEEQVRDEHGGACKEGLEAVRAVVESAAGRAGEWMTEAHIMNLLGSVGARPLDGEDAVVTGIAYRSDAVSPGDAFFCIRGFAHDGHDFADDAVQRGAVAVVVERPVAGISAPQFQVADGRVALALASAEFYGNPSRSMDLVGITGTNGKTTTTYLLDSIFRADGRVTGIVGTVETRVAGERIAAKRTTPESSDLEALLAQMREAGVSAAALEVSSHAIDLHRVDGVHFAVAAFTNLTQDHLDYHSTLEEYFSVKRRLFTDFDVAARVINIDDPAGASLAAEIPGAITVGTNPSASVYARDIELSASGASFELIAGTQAVRVTLPLAGAYNVSNALVAAGCALGCGIDLATVARGLDAAPQVPGRLERVDEGRSFSVIVDYAHTPDSLEKAIKAVKDVTEGRVIVVFGCGGDRDPDKRPLMGRVAAFSADHVIVTSDNPRSEDPVGIILQIQDGLRDGEASWEVEVDRAKAIARAISLARPGDAVLIAGKGHEDYQIFADRTIHFDDREVARAELATRC